MFTVRALGGDPDAWEREYRFAPPRRWRADFAHVASRVLVEIEGGVWTRGRHVRGDGFRRDCEKYNAAAADGWRVFRLTTEMASDPDEVGQILAATRGGEVDDGE